MEREPWNPEKPRRPQKKLVLNNQVLLMIVGILSAILVLLLVIGGSILNSEAPEVTGIPSAGDSGSSSVNSSSAQTTPSSEVPQPSSNTEPQTTASTAPTTAPTPPVTKPPVTPTGGKYIDVGSGYIAEVIQPNVETFDGKTSDDYSRPTNNYLPEGTLDYCAREYVYNSSTKYVLLRSGYRVYVEKRIYPPVRMEKEVKLYEGTLPDHNEIGFSSLETVGKHSVLTLDVLWKAPFYFETNQSGYSNPNGGSDRSYAISSNNATYVDITFCYATVFTGKVSIPAGHPLFKSAEVIKNESDYTLRLHLRKTGSLYGWHAYYNSNGQLCFQFLNPAKATAGDNKYGANLSGVTVMLDVGHGGVDGGASGTDAQGQAWEEADLNLNLAMALKKELESAGATVILNRSDDSKIDINARIKDMLDKAPDICIAIHQNSYSSAKVGGFDSMYFTPWSYLLAKNIRENTKDSGIYTKTYLKWSVNYFMMRQTLCPVVLTENGYMSNPDDLAAMLDPVKVEGKATSIAQGIADYFLTINK